MKKLLLAIIAINLLLGANLVSAAGYTQTKYPIVLVHGFSGFDSVGGLIGYFHTIPYNLRRSGAKVYVPSVSAFNSSEARGEQLADYLSGLRESKFNLIGHSQGSPTSRVAASLVPNKVASVTSVNGVNRGSKVADVLLGLVPEGVAQNLVGSILDAVGGVINLISGANNAQDSIASAKTLSTAGSMALNQTLGNKGIDPNCASMNEDVNINGYNIKMFSWSGNRAFTNVFDLTDPFLSATSLAFAGEQNDGLVGVCSARLGQVISTSYSLNHVDAINHLFGVRGWTNPVSLYRYQANRLRNKGL
ncbi:esterase/lipase family protein [Arenicella xantha]|uniref:Triacylglycerol lipase n=1 Tax=Arenicella xantha TaxID=644221 RepID=A0A395JQ79_9GAMM|nr:alpha/beta fold hydrolase [Arenicella xantha]RBP53769.1 triacylglycerol lipase [Arenicella xantha]